MNPFRKRSKSTSAGEGKARKGKGAVPQIVSTADLELSLPNANDFRTSLLFPKMADRFSLLRADDGAEEQPRQVNGQSEVENQHSTRHTRDLSVLEERDELDEELPVLPWGREEQTRIREEPVGRDGHTKDDFIRIRAQEGNSSLFSGKQRTFKIRSEEGNCSIHLLNWTNSGRHR
jgi:hypothetical protein